MVDAGSPTPDVPHRIQDQSGRDQPGQDQQGQDQPGQDQQGQVQRGEPLGAATWPAGVEVLAGAATPDRWDEVLTPAALELVATLHRTAETRRRDLIAVREVRRAACAAAGTVLPDPASDPSATSTDAASTSGAPGTPVRPEDWRLPPAPADLADRRVEITGPADPRMAANALTSGAKVWMADLEDASTPHWRNVLGSQVVLRDVVRRMLSGTTADGRAWALPTDGDLATLVVRPRGLHLVDPHVLVDGAPVAGALLDAALFLAGNAAELLARGSGPYLYLPKLESAAEAALWHDVLVAAETSLGLATGTVRVTVLVETISAAFAMDDVLAALDPYATGLNAGRWDYLFSIIKTFRDAGPDFLLPDRSDLAMSVPFLRAYTTALVATCHRRGAHAIGGMAAFVPSRRDPEAAARALAKVAEDKRREAGDGFDGSWVAHPDLVATCREAFDAVLGDAADQLTAHAGDAPTTAGLLDLASAGGSITAAGLRGNVSVGLRYLHAWLGGRGAVALDGLMEDAATAEICRSQVWQWVRAGVATEDGEPVTAQRVRALLAEQAEQLRATAGEELVDVAVALFEQVALSQDFPAFLTTAVALDD